MEYERTRPVQNPALTWAKQAKEGTLPDDFNRWKAKFEQQPIAHIAAKFGKLPEPLKTNMDILSIADGGGYRVAHILAQKGEKFFDKQILAWANNYGHTVAHAMAESGHVFDENKDQEILEKRNAWGWTVAHEMAMQGHRFTRKNILSLTSDNGETVEKVYKRSIERE